MALQILRALEEEGTRKRSKEVLLKAPVAVVNLPDEPEARAYRADRGAL